MSAEEQQIGRRFNAMMRGAYRAGWHIVFTGRRIDNFTVTMAGAPDNQMYVRYPDDSREYTTVWGRIVGTSAPIWVGPAADGGEEYKGPAWQLGTALYGPAYITMVQPVVIGSLLPQSVPDIGFVPGRLGPSVKGGTFVHVDAFDHAGGRWEPAADGSNDLDVDAFYPATANFYGQIGVYHNPTTNTLHAFAGEQSLIESDFTLADRALVPAGMYPIGAAIVKHGSGIDGSNQFPDWRFHLDEKGYQLVGQSAARQISGGVLAVGNESYVVVSPETGGDDTVETITITGAARDITFVAATGKTITFTHEADNIHLNALADFVISGYKALKLFCDGTDARDVSAGAGGSGGGVDLLGGAPSTTGKRSPGGELMVAPSDIVRPPGAVILPAGSGTITVGLVPWRTPNVFSETKQITRAVMSIDTAPEGQDAIADILKNGVSIFSDPSHRPRIVDGAFTGETTTIDDADWEADDYLQVEVIQRGSTVFGANLTISVVFI